jgi:hypothetical protein
LLAVLLDMVHAKFRLGCRMPRRGRSSCNSHDCCPTTSKNIGRTCSSYIVGRFIFEASCSRFSEPACPPRALVARATQFPAVLCEARFPTSVRRGSRRAADWVRRNTRPTSRLRRCRHAPAGPRILPIYASARSNMPSATRQGASHFNGASEHLLPTVLL